MSGHDPDCVYSGGEDRSVGGRERGSKERCQETSVDGKE